MFKQLCWLQRYTFLHELPNVFNTFLHELSSYSYTFLHELPSCTCIFYTNFPRITFMTTAFPSYSVAVPQSGHKKWLLIIYIFKSTHIYQISFLLFAKVDNLIHICKFFFIKVNIILYFSHFQPFSSVLWRTSVLH